MLIVLTAKKRIRYSGFGLTILEYFRIVYYSELPIPIQHHVNPQNDCVWSRDREVGPQRVTRAQGAASVMVWAAVIESGKTIINS